MLIAVEITATIYLLGFLYSYMVLRAIILNEFSELGWCLHRGAIFRRALLWFTPGWLYYWRDAKWAKKADQYE